MAQSESVATWGAGVDISPPKLVGIDFASESADLSGKTVNTEFTLSVHRFSLLELGVQLSAALVGVPDLRARVSYRMIATLREGAPEAAEPEVAFRQIATRLLPVALYPFVRETLASIAQRALLQPMILPVQNIGALWSADDLEIPPVPAPAGGGAAPMDFPPRGGHPDKPVG